MSVRGPFSASPNSISACRTENARRVLHAVGVCAGLLLVLSTAPAADEPTFLAGAAVADVTPDEPVPMWGYGSRHAKLSDGTLDPLLASVVVIQAGGEKLAIVGLDLGRSPSEESLQRIRTRIATESGIPHSLIAGSHTHHGPVLELANRPGRGQGRFDAALRYYTKLENGIVSAIAEANDRLKPATLASGTTDVEGFNRNRHSKQPTPPLDKSLHVLRLDDSATGKTIAVLVNFTAHPTSLPDEVLKFSADYVGALRTEVQSVLGGVTIFMQGASGDLSTDRTSHGDHSQYGRALGRKAVELATSLKPAPVDSPSLKVHEERLTFESRTDFRNPVIQAVYSIAFFPELVMNFVDEYSEGIRPRLTVVVLNDRIALVGGSGEFFCQHAIRLRQRARVDHLFFFGYCNGYHQYFPTIEAAAEGGYGADSQVAPAEVGAGERMMDTALAWIYRLQGARL